jgi:transposase
MGLENVLRASVYPRRVVIEIVKRNELHRFVVLPRRWVGERTFAWLVKCRRLGWDYERLPSIGWFHRGKARK